MMQTNRFKLLVVSLVLATTACTNDVALLEKTSATGDAFTNNLTKEYRKLARYEAREMVDWPDADRFAAKGLATARGIAVRPERPEDWRTPDNAMADLKTGHRRLVAILETGVRSGDPQTAAAAQARFDCWVEQQEENWQVEHIAACRSAFRQALADLENSPEVQAARFTMVLFPFDSARITSPEAEIIAPLIDAASGLGFSAIEVAGHTDRRGSRTYNQQLSRTRADAVRQALIREGVSPANISLSAWGETRPRVKTADNIREALNRRVEIWLRKPLETVETAGLKKW
jgi:OOP family OmpA-OmpF porin